MMNQESRLAPVAFGMGLLFVVVGLLGAAVAQVDIVSLYLAVAAIAFALGASLGILLYEFPAWYASLWFHLSNAAQMRRTARELNARPVTSGPSRIIDYELTSEELPNGRRLAL